MAHCAPRNAAGGWEPAPPLRLLCNPQSVTAGIPGRCVPKRPGQSQPRLMLLPRERPRGKPGARTAFVHVPTPALAKTAKQPRCLVPAPRKLPAAAGAPCSGSLSSRHHHAQCGTSKARPLPQEKPRRVGSSPLCNRAGARPGQAVSHAAPCQAAGRLQPKLRLGQICRVPVSFLSSPGNCFTPAETTRFFCPRATEPTRSHLAPKLTKTSPCCSAENVCGWWGKAS